jgi:phospholipase/carboxylesterase
MNRALQVIPNKIDKSILILPDHPCFSLIWLHGLGDSPLGFLEYFQLPQSPAFKGARVNLLHAPQRKVTINGGALDNSWYDIRSLGATGSDQDRFNLEEVKDSMAIIDSKVKAEIAFWKENGIKDSE